MTDVAAMLRGDAVAAKVGEMVSSDGRNRRAAETRRKVIEAAKAMIAETSVAPTVVGVAKRADVSVRSVFQHFGDVESLFVTVVDSVGKDLVVPPTTSEALPLSERVASFIRNMGQLYDQIVPLRVAAGQFVNHPGLIERGLIIQNGLRDAVSRIFEHEFALLSDAGKESLADAITAALSLDAWVSLRRNQNLSFERAVAAWRLTLGALLSLPALQVAAE
jgi:AcrR family transcriptional regulator